VETLNVNTAGNAKTVTFNNCKFGYFKAADNMYNVYFIFNNCTFTGLNGSNCECNNCYSGGTVGDALNPLRNFSVKNSYISNLSIYSTSSVHTDGFQIRGFSGIVAENILFDNVRMEAPQLKITGNNSDVNACMMIQMEASNGTNMTFKDMYINGGGYTIYSWAKASNVTLTNITYDNIKVGCSKRYGTLYPTMASGIDYSDITSTDKLYVSTVSRDGLGNTDIIVSNDTNVEKTLTIVTNLGITTHTIPKCLTYSELITDVTTFNDLPFDVKITLEDEVDYVICYDGSIDGNNHIRFYNWTTDPVYIEEEE